MNRVEHAICRIRERFPQQETFVTLGVGCVVRNEVLATSLGWKCPNLLVTSAHVLSPQHLSSDRIFIAEFLGLEKKGSEVFELKPAADFCKTLCGRNLSEQSGSLQNEQLIVISVEPLDKRGFLKRMVKKSSLQTTRPIDCFDFHNYDNEIEDGIFCNVIREFGSFAEEFETRTYKFKFSKIKNAYFLEDFLRKNVQLEEQCFPSDQVPGGAVVFSKQGLYLGCLTYEAGQIMPSFVPDVYYQLQEENPEREEQKECEVEGIQVDSEKDNIDENENRDLNEKEMGLDNGNEQACGTETRTENEESSVAEEKQELDDNSQSTEVEKELETKNPEGVSQGEVVGPDLNSENTEIKLDNFQRDSTEGDDVVVQFSSEAEHEREGSENSNIEKEVDPLSDAEVENLEQEILTSDTEIRENVNENDTSYQDKPEDTCNQELSDNCAESSPDNTLDTEHDSSISTSICVNRDTVVSEIQEDTMETKRQENNTLGHNNEDSIEGEVAEPSPENNDTNNCEPTVLETQMTDTEVSLGCEKSSDMEVSGYQQELQMKHDIVETPIDSSTSNQDSISLDKNTSEGAPCEYKEASENKEDKLEYEQLCLHNSSKEEAKEDAAIEEKADDQNQVSIEEQYHEETAQEQSPESKQELLVSSEERKSSQKDDEIILIQERTMSTDQQAENPRDVIKLVNPVDPKETGKPLEPDDLLTAKITNNPKALDDLAILLDTEYQHGGVSSWYDLAELLAIPKEAYSHCMSFSKPSPTEDLLVFLSSTKPQFSISDLKDSLKAINRQDVVHIIDRYIARSVISNGTVIQGVIEREDIDLLGELALKLDRGHQSNWKVLARQLDVPSRIFRNFGSHQRQNSALLMLKYLPIFDPDLTVESLKDSCKTVGLNDLVKFLDSSGVPGEDAIMDILGDGDFIGELTDNLNEEDEAGPNWKRLGRELKIPEEKFSIFEPSSMNSPTKMLLQSIAKCEPDITVDELILALVAMKRHDVIEMLSKHFRHSDIRSILEENNCLPPESPRTDNSRQDAEESTA